MKKNWLPRSLRLLTVCMVTICLLLSAFAPTAMATTTGTPKTIKFSLSMDGVPLIPQTEVTIPWYALSTYGLSQYNRYEAASFENGGQYINTNLVTIPTVLHAFLTMHERTYGANFNSTSRSNYFDFSGSATSMFITKLFNIETYNLMYFCDHEYPLMAAGWGSTADYILLEDGMTVDVGVFTDMGFWTEGAFLAFDRDDYYMTPSGTRTVTVSAVPTTGHATGETGTVTPKAGAEIHLLQVTGTALEDYTDLGLLGMTNSDGTFTLNLANVSATLTAGQTYVLAAYGRNAGTNTACEVAAYAQLHIVGEVPTLTGVSLSEYNDAILYAEQKLKLKPAVTAEHADASFTFTSSNTSAATVDMNGTVEAQYVSADTPVTITCTATDGTNSYTASCNLTIKTGTPVTGVSLNHDYIELGLNSTCTALTATVTPSNASNTTVNWTSTNLNTVHINHLGTMTGAGTGVATITAESVMSTTSNPMKDTCRVACGGKFGDANGDGVVNNADITRAKEMADGDTSGTYFAFVDINGDGIINSMDINLIKQIIDGDLDIYVQQ